MSLISTGFKSPSVSSITSQQFSYFILSDFSKGLDSGDQKRGQGEGGGWGPRRAVRPHRSQDGGAPKAELGLPARRGAPGTVRGRRAMRVGAGRGGGGASGSLASV